jgi:chemotaxis protein MotA
MNTRVDLSTLLGILAAFGLIATAIAYGGSAKAFLDVASVLIVVLGTVSLIVASFSFKDVMKAFGLTARTIIYPTEDPRQTAYRLVQLSEESRANGVLSIQPKIDAFPSGSFQRKALTLVVDGIEPPQVERTLTQDIYARSERHDRGIAVLRKGADIAPAMGLIGTLIGLVQMLGNLDDPSSIGPAMAVALLTTMYGAILAFLIFTPLSTKLERLSDNEMVVQKLYLKAASSIAAKENPRRLEELLNAILPAEQRISYFN